LLIGHNYSEQNITIKYYELIKEFDFSKKTPHSIFVQELINVSKMKMTVENKIKMINELTKTMIDINDNVLSNPVNKTKI